MLVKKLEPKWIEPKWLCRPIFVPIGKQDRAPTTTDCRDGVSMGWPGRGQQDVMVGSMANGEATVPTVSTSHQPCALPHTAMGRAYNNVVCRDSRPSWHAKMDGSGRVSCMRR